MNRLAVFIAGGLAVVVVAGVFLMRRPAPEAAVDPVETAETAVAPEGPAAPPAVVAPEPTPSAGTARRAPAIRPEVEEAPAPTVEAGPAPVDVATLRIDSDVAGAQVFLDRQFLGPAPVTAENVVPGSHQLNVSAEGFDGIARTIEVTPGPRDITVRFREVRLDARLAVVHRHRIGSCRGELVATPQGIRYETANRDDAFTVSLGDLEQFEIEYLDKTLRLKSRRGRQFNFTDPDANADRLFVFHRDVDKARTQLASGFAAAP